MILLFYVLVHVSGVNSASFLESGCSFTSIILQALFSRGIYTVLIVIIVVSFVISLISNEKNRFYKLDLNVADNLGVTKAFYGHSVAGRFLSDECSKNLYGKDSMQDLLLNAEMKSNSLRKELLELENVRGSLEEKCASLESMKVQLGERLRETKLKAALEIEALKKNFGATKREFQRAMVDREALQKELEAVKREQRVTDCALKDQSLLTENLEATKKQILYLKDCLQALQREKNEALGILSGMSLKPNDKKKRVPSVALSEGNTERNILLSDSLLEGDANRNLLLSDTLLEGDASRNLLLSDPLLDGDTNRNLLLSDPLLEGDAKRNLLLFDPLLDGDTKRNLLLSDQLLEGDAKRNLLLSDQLLEGDAKRNLLLSDPLLQGDAKRNLLLSDPLLQGDAKRNLLLSDPLLQGDAKRNLLLSDTSLEETDIRIQSEPGELSAGSSESREAPPPVDEPTRVVTLNSLTQMAKECLKKTEELHETCVCKSVGIECLHCVERAQAANSIDLRFVTGSTAFKEFLTGVSVTECS